MVTLLRPVQAPSAAATRRRSGCRVLDIRLRASPAARTLSNRRRPAATDPGCSLSRLLPVEEVVVGLDVLGQVPQLEDLAVTKSEDVHLVQRDRRAVGTTGRLVEDHGGVVVVGVDAFDVEGLRA